MSKGSGGSRGGSSIPQRNSVSKYIDSDGNYYNPDKHTEISSRTLKAFNDMGISSKEVINFLEAQNDEIQKAGIDVTRARISGNSDGFNLAIRGNGISMTRYINRLPEGGYSVENAYFEMPDDKRGGGLGRRLFAGQLKMWQKMNVSHIDVHADISNGSYTWARFGFRMDRNNYNDYIRKFERNGLKDIALAMRNEKSYRNGDYYVNIRKITDMVGRDGIPFKEKMKPLMMHDNWYGRVDLKNPEDLRYYKKYVNSGNKKK